MRLRRLTRRSAASLARRVRGALPVLAAVTATLLVVRGIAPAQAHAVDLFPIDDWIGDGLKAIGDVVLGGLKFGAREIAKLIGTLVVALADLLIPKSLVKAGVNGIKWLVQLPPLGAAGGVDTLGAAAPVRMPHLAELRGTLTWVGLTLLPLQIVIAGGRAMLSPTRDGDSPADVLQRVIAAGIGLLAFEWLWGALTHLVGLITTGLLSLPWVATGIERMLETLVIGAGAGSAVAAEFVIPLILVVAGGALLALLLLRIGLEVVAALVYAIGGIAIGLSPSSFGHRLLQAWLFAATAVFVLPVLWTIVFVCGAALMLDSGPSAGRGGFGSFVAQLYNVGAALVVFMVAIKLAKGTMVHAGGAITGLAGSARLGGGRSSGGGAAGGRGVVGWAAKATPASVASFSQRLRGGLRGGAAAAGRAASFPVRHPVRSAQAASYPARRPVQATQEAAGGLRDALSGGAVSAAAGAESLRGRAGRALDRERHDGPYSRRSADRRQQQPQPGAAPARPAGAATRPSTYGGRPPAAVPARPGAPAGTTSSTTSPTSTTPRATALVSPAARPAAARPTSGGGDGSSGWRWTQRVARAKPKRSAKAKRPANRNRKGR